MQFSGKFGKCVSWAPPRGNPGSATKLYSVIFAFKWLILWGNYHRTRFKKCFMAKRMRICEERPADTISLTDVRPALCMRTNQEPCSVTARGMNPRPQTTYPGQHSECVVKPVSQFYLQCNKSVSVWDPLFKRRNGVPQLFFKITSTLTFKVD